MSTNPPPKPKAGLSLYASLLESPGQSASSATITGAPVTFKQPGNDAPAHNDGANQKQQITALRFQPTKRPAIASQKQQGLKTAQARAAALTAAIAAPAASTADKNGLAQAAQPAAAQPAAAPPKTTIADWTGDGDDADVNGFYGEKRQRGGRKKRKKNKQEAPVAQNWDDIYDPSRPNTYEAYKNSDEKIREIRDWKDRLYAHRMARRSSDYSESDDDRPALKMNNQFAPPSMNFASPPLEPTAAPAPPAPPAQVPDDPTGEDAYARRLRMSQHAGNPSPQSQPPPRPSAPGSLGAVPPPPPPPTEQHTISRAPVRYNLPAAPAEIPRSEAELEKALLAEQEDSGDVAADGEAPADAPRSLRPGQKGFAERLMGKYGWTKGTGLGANNSGILNPLRVKLEKQKKRPDAEGGGVIGPSGGIGKIIGGQRKKVAGEEEGGKFGNMSEVVKLKGMVAGMDLDYELGEGNLMQEIGDECGEKYGRVERVYIGRDDPADAPVFIKFTNQLSALRAVNALEGRIFNGNNIAARFFDSEKFDKGIYD